MTPQPSLASILTPDATLPDGWQRLSTLPSIEVKVAKGRITNAQGYIGGEFLKWPAEKRNARD